MTKMKKVATDERHQKLYNDLCEALDKNKELEPIHMLALVAQLTGRLIAMQDQTKYSSETLMPFVAENIREGNLEMIASVFNFPVTSKGN